MKWTATGPHWFLGFGEVRNGKAYVAQEKEPLLCPRVFALYLPRFSLIQTDDRASEFFLQGNIHHGELPKEMPEKALLFTPDSWSLPPHPSKAAEFISRGTKKFQIEILKNPSYLVDKAKREVDQTFSKELKFAPLAFKLKTNAAALSREFKTQCGLSLTEYHELLQKTDKKLSAFSSGESLLAKSFSLLDAQLAE